VPKQSRDSAAPVSFVIKARHQAHRRTMERLPQHRGRTKRQASMVCHSTEIALVTSVVNVSVNHRNNGQYPPIALIFATPFICSAVISGSTGLKVILLIQ
jgi:hypothetical protein